MTARDARLTTGERGEEHHSRSRAWLYWLVGAVAVAGCLVEFRYRPSAPPISAPTVKPVPPFNLIEKSGRPLGLSDLKGKVWLASFIYTSCPGPCPTITKTLSDLQQEAFQSREVRFVSFSVHPEVDTPAELQKYATNFGAHEQWLFATGDKAQIRELVTRGFTLAMFEQADPANPVIHSQKIALVDRSGMIRGFYDGLGSENGVLLQEIKRLLRK